MEKLPDEIEKEILAMLKKSCFSRWCIWNGEHDESDLKQHGCEMWGLGRSWAYIHLLENHGHDYKELLQMCLEWYEEFEGEYGGPDSQKTNTKFERGAQVEPVYPTCTN